MSQAVRLKQKQNYMQYASFASTRVLSRKSLLDLLGVTWLGMHLHDHFIPHARNNYHPHIFHHRSMALFSVLLVSLKIFTVSLLSLGPVVPAFSSAITGENIVSLTNQSRVAYGLGILKENSVLAQAAQAKAEDMVAQGYFAHESPEGKTPWDFITAKGYSYSVAGENLAVNFSEAENVESAWMDSPGHKANILNKNFEEIGIGIAQGEYQGQNSVFVVQMFGTPVSQKVTLQEKPTVVQTQAIPTPSAIVAQTPNVKPEPLQEEGLVAGAELSQVSELAITEAKMEYREGHMVVVAHLSGFPVRALAVFGQRAVLMHPTSEGQWQAEIETEKLTNQDSDVGLLVRVFDIAGNFKQAEVATFAGSTPQNYKIISTAHAAQVQFLGRTISPKVLENNFYMMFIAALLASLVIAIAVRRHVQHLSLVTNGAFVVMLASLLWMTG